MRRIHDSVTPAWRTRAVWQPLLLAAGLVLVLGACDSLFEVDNPNDVLQEALEGGAESADALVNGSQANTAQALGQVVIDHMVTSDETDWIGSSPSAAELEHGQLRALTTNGTFNALSTARWLSDYTIRLLESFAADGELSNDLLLGQAYLYSGINYEMIASMFDDFTVSDRADVRPPIGEENMHMIYDTALVRLDAAIEVARNVGNADLELTALAMRARTEWAKALWYKLNPKGEGVPHGGPLVNDPDANADAEQVIAMAQDPDWMYRFHFSSSTIENDVAEYINSRHEVIFGPEFGKWDENQLAICSPYNERCPSEELVLQDPIDGISDPALEQIIFEFIGGRDYSPQTVVTLREMHLILAEAALAASGGSTPTPEFVEHINAVRGLYGDLSPYDPGAHAIEPLDLLKHERLVNLFLQTRRLADMYRFTEPAEEWLSNAPARTEPGTFFKIGDDEAHSNCYIVGTC